jgi:hypothetical protein
MKKYFLFVIFGALAYSVNAQTNWKQIGQDAFTKTYIDLGSVREKLDPQLSAVVDLITMIDYPKIAEDSNNTNVSYASSSSAKASISCQHQNFRILSNKFFNKHNAVGQPFYDWNGGPWRHINAGDGQVKVVHKAVCG